MAAAVGKYGLKIADEAADWVKNLKFGLSKADKDHEIIVVDVDALESVFDRGGLDYVSPGAITTPGYRNHSVGTRYADFVEFAEKNQDTPIHMPVARFDGSGTFYGFDNGRHRFAALRDAGLKEIPVAVRKSEASRVPVYLNPKPLEKTDVPITGNTRFKPTELNPAQKKELDALSEAGYPQHTAKSIVLGDLPMDTASRTQRQQAQNLTATGYHGSHSNDLINLERDIDFWMAESPVVSNTYLPTNVLDEPGTIYKMAYNPDKYATTNARGEFWSNLDQIPMTIRKPGANIPNTVKGLSNKYLGKSVVDTDDLANLVDEMGLPGIEINEIRDAGSNFKQARNLFTDTKGVLDNKSWNQFLNEYDTFGGKNIVAVGDKTGLRSATGAAFDPRNKALPNIMGGSAALAVGLGANDSEAAVKRLDAIMAGGMKTPGQQAQAVISGKSLNRQGPTYEAVTNKTIADNLQANPDVGSITGIQPGYDNQLRGQAAFALQDFGKSAQDAGPAGFIAGSAIEHIGDALQKGAYGESDWYDVPLVALDLMALNPMSYLSSGMRSAMNNPDAKASIFKELFGN
jgi:hypothetical protein